MREHFPVAQRRVAGTGVRAYMLYIFTKLTPALSSCRVVRSPCARHSETDNRRNRRVRCELRCLARSAPRQSVCTTPDALRKLVSIERLGWHLCPNGSAMAGVRLVI